MGRDIKMVMKELNYQPPATFGTTEAPQFRNYDNPFERQLKAVVDKSFSRESFHRRMLKSQKDRGRYPPLVVGNMIKR